MYMLLLNLSQARSDYQELCENVRAECLLNCVPARCALAANLPTYS
jgi:hypothetical protein